MTKLRIASSSYHIGHSIAPVAALEKGFFREEGLADFELLIDGLLPSFVEAQALSIAMKERGIPIVLGAKIPSVLALHSQGEDLCIVGGWRLVPQSEWYARPGIASLADMKGKKIGTRDRGNTGPSRILCTELRKAGVDPDKDITWVYDRIFAYHRTRDHVDALKSGMVDLTGTTPPFFAELESFGCTNVLSTKKLFPGGKPMSVIVARKSIVDERRAELTALLRGVIRGFWLERNSENFAWLVDLESRMRAASPNEDEQVLRLLTSADRLERRPLPVDGRVPLDGLREIAEEMKQDGELPADYNVDGVLIDGPARDAFAALRARKELAAEWERIERIVEQQGY